MFCVQDGVLDAPAAQVTSQDLGALDGNRTHQDGLP